MCLIAGLLPPSSSHSNDDLNRALRRTFRGAHFLKGNTKPVPPTNSSVQKEWGGGPGNNRRQAATSNGGSQSANSHGQIAVAPLPSADQESLSKVFSARLSAMRQLRGLTQRELSKKARVQYISITLFEGGHRLPSLATLCLLGGALDVTTDYLLGTTDILSSDIHKVESNTLSSAQIAKYSDPEHEDRIRSLPVPRPNKGSARNMRKLGDSPFFGSPGTNLSNRIAEDLGVAIVGGKYSEQDGRFVESDLCQHYNVCLVIVREAMRMLKAKGLLGAAPRRGTWVEPAHRWNLFDPDVLRWMLAGKPSATLSIDLMQMQLAVEPVAACLAARSDSPAEKSLLKGSLEAMIGADSDDELLSSDVDFHVALLLCTGNRFYSQLRQFIEVARRHVFSTATRAARLKAFGIAEHQAIAYAILNRDAIAAECAMRNLISDSLSVIRNAESNSGSRVHQGNFATAVRFA